jgi:hypothetical protein
LKKGLIKKELIDVTGSIVTFLDPVYCLWFKKEVLNVAYFPKG